jgi:hypothetical protein
MQMPCDGIAVLAAKPVRIDVVGELSTPAGRKALQAYLEAVGLAVEGVEAGQEAVTVRLKGGAWFTLQRCGGSVRVVGYGLGGLGADFLTQRLADCERVAGLLLQQRVLAALQKVVRVDRVSRASNGAVVVEACI